MNEQEDIKVMRWTAGALTKQLPKIPKWTGSVYQHGDPRNNAQDEDDEE